MSTFSRFLVIGSLVFAYNHLEAQTSPGTFRLGAQLGYGTETESLGFGLRADYSVTENILIAPDFIYFLGKDNIDWFDLNFNGNLLFGDRRSTIIPYVLAGLNIAIISDGVGDFFINDNDTEIGLNVGGGIDFEVGNLLFFGELRYVISNADQLVFTGGAKFPLN